METDWKPADTAPFAMKVLVFGWYAESWGYTEARYATVIGSRHQEARDGKVIKDQWSVPQPTHSGIFTALFWQALPEEPRRGYPTCRNCLSGEVCPTHRTGPPW